MPTTPTFLSSPAIAFDLSVFSLLSRNVYYSNNNNNKYYTTQADVSLFWP